MKKESDYVCVFVTVLFTIAVFSAVFYVLPGEENMEQALVKISDIGERLTIDILGGKVIERHDEYALVEASPDAFSDMKNLGMQVQRLDSSAHCGTVTDGTNNYTHTSKYDTNTAFPGYDEFVHSMINQTSDSSIYDYIDILQNFENDNGVPTRVTGSSGFDEAALWTYHELRSYGLEVFMQNFTSSGYSSTNVIAVLPGTDPDLYPETFIIGGHLDSINNRGTSEPAPGADDNASGIAVTLEAARIMSQYNFKRTIRFAAWGAEEQGLHGSGYYVSNIDPSEEKVMGYLNYDMLGYADGELAVTLHANTESNWMLDYMAEVRDTYDIGINFTYIYDSTETRSDHARFWNAGYNATLAIETVFSPYYHSEDDTLDKLTIPQITHSTRHAIATLAHLAEPDMQIEAFDIPLVAGGESDGWNFVSCNLIPTDNSITAILDDPVHGIQGNYDRLMYYDSSIDEWSSYVPGRAARYNTLDTWDYRMGIWIRMTNSDTLTIAGTVPANTDITVEPGWNMVGYPSNEQDVGDLPGVIDTIGYFEASAEYNLAYDYSPGAFVFEPGKGYWLHNPSETAVTWTVDY